MATITINIPDAQVNRVVNGFCAAYGWTDADGPKAAFAKARLIDHIKNVVQGQERASAEQAAIDAVTVPDVALT